MLTMMIIIMMMVKMRLCVAIPLLFPLATRYVDDHADAYDDGDVITTMIMKMMMMIYGVAIPMLLIVTVQPLGLCHHLTSFSH